VNGVEVFDTRDLCAIERGAYSSPLVYKRVWPWTSQALSVCIKLTQFTGGKKSRLSLFKVGQGRKKVSAHLHCFQFYVGDTVSKPFCLLEEA
jgi:hypothetical protein